MATESIALSPTAQAVLEARYLLRDEHGRVVETPTEMLRRVARAVAAVDRRYQPAADLAGLEERFYQVMARREFLPNSPTLMNAGARLGQLMACFVLPIEDSLESIFETLKHAALIWQTAGGTGFSFSKLRPDGDRVASTGGEASGPVSFIEIFDTAAEVMRRGGLRRSANMGILAAEHPDIHAFIRAKEQPGALPNFNLSVSASDEFMAAARAGRSIDLVNPRSGRVVGKAGAADLLDQAALAAWRSGDPGMVFIDRINRDNPTPQLGRIEATNPCGEQPLLPYEACVLGSINLERFVGEQAGQAMVDEAHLGAVVETAVHFLDNVIDATRYPLPEIERMCQGNRKIGLGVMGFADLLIRLGVPYDSEQALEVAERLMALISRRADEASAQLAEQRGAFPNYRGSALDRPGARPVRNATRLTIAPTGTISIIAGCSSGIEPLFALSFTRRILEREFREVHPLFRAVAEREGFASEEVLQQVAQRGTVQGVERVPPHFRRLFVTAHEIAPEWHVRMQAAFQRHTDNAVSKPVNLPAHARQEHVRAIFQLAHALDCKGITVYRYGSKDSQVLNINPYCLSCAEDGLEHPARALAGRAAERSSRRPG